MKRLGLAVLACMLAAGPALAQPRGDNTSPPPPGAPNMVVPTRPMLTWFGAQVSDPPAVHLQLSTQAVVGTTVEGQTLIVSIAGVDLDSRQTWNKVDVSRFETMPILSIEVSRTNGGAIVRLEFKPGIVPTVSPSVNLGTDGFTYVLLNLSGAAVPAAVTGAEPTTTTEPATLPTVVEDREMAELRTREGFTLDVSAGIGISQLRSGGGSQTEFAVSGLNISLGGWLNDATALLVRASVGTGIVSNNDDDGEGGTISPNLTSSLAFTAGGHRNFGESYFVAGGLGFGRQLLDFEDANETGFAVDIRGGKFFKPSPRGTWFIAAEVTPVFYAESNVIITAAVQIGWQLY